MVDDVSVNLVVVEKMLDNIDYQVESASDGFEEELLVMQFCIVHRWAISSAHRSA